jgi:nicotinate phosphoribosyltransferase
MGYAIHEHHPDVVVTFELIMRDKTIALAEVIDEAELRAELEHARSLRLDSLTDLSWLGGMRVYGKNMFSDEFVFDFLAKLSLPPFVLSREGKGYKICFTGRWEEVTYWETIALSIVNELYYRSLMRRMSSHELDLMFAAAKLRLWGKVEELKRHPEITFMGFDTRRRFSFLWQLYVAQLCRKELGAQYAGISNTWIAFNQGIIPMGTNAHELPMVLVALADTPEAKRDAQYQVKREWAKLYGPGLRILLPDAFGTKQFLDNAPDELAHEWRGMRQDSGDPVEIGEMYIAWLHSHGVDPKTKLIIFSDGLDVADMVRLSAHFTGRINVTFGWGTLLGNDFRDCFPRAGELRDLMRPISMACKGKVTGDPIVAEEYRKIFGADTATERAIIV